jgi:hypothetical protein
MSRRSALAAAALVAAMALFGFLVYRGLGHYKSLGTEATAAAAKPQDTQAAFPLPGTIYLSQNGDIYALRDAHFQLVLTHDATRGAWMQPAPTADGHNLVVVGRTATSSDLYLVDLNGQIVRQLTHNAAAKRTDGSLEDNHWAFHPRVDGNTLWYTYDSPKGGYLVDFSVWTAALDAPAPARGVRPAGGITGAKRMTTPHDYTGGDIDATPLAQGGVLFVRYSVDSTEHIRAQLFVNPTPPRGTGTALTDIEADCSQPDLSPDGVHLVMTCTQGEQTAQLVVRTLTGTTVGPPVVVASSVLGANATWAPDGHSLVYLAPAATGGQFQLWYIDKADTATPAAPRQVTSGIGLDGTSRPAWTAS